MLPHLEATLAILSAPSKEGHRAEGRRLKDDTSGDDAPMLAGELGVRRDCTRWREVEIALERKPERAVGYPSSPYSPPYATPDKIESATQPARRHRPLA